MLAEQARDWPGESPWQRADGRGGAPYRKWPPGQDTKVEVSAGLAGLGAAFSIPGDPAALSPLHSLPTCPARPTSELWLCPFHPQQVPRPLAGPLRSSPFWKIDPRESGLM